jgi:hypothetical protein
MNSMELANPPHARAPRFVFLLCVALATAGCTLPRLGDAPPVRLPTTDPEASLPLAAKAARFEEELDADHLEFWGGLAYRVRRPEGDDGPRRVWYQSDQTCWTGALLGAECERWAATGDAAALHRVRSLLRGLTVLTEITGERGLWARYARPPGREEREGDTPYAHDGASGFEGWRWRGDLSKDQLAGLVFGLCAVTDLVDDPWSRARAARLLSELADRIESRGLQIVEKGRVTTYGDLSPRVKGVPIGVHGAVLLGLAEGAWRATGDPRHRRFLERLVADDVPATLRIPTIRVFAKENWNNPNMVAMALASILRRPPEGDAPLMERTLHREAAGSLATILDLHRGEGNAFWIAVAAPSGKAAGLRERDLEDARRQLAVFPVRKVEEPVDHRGRTDLDHSWWTSRRGRPRVTTPLPVDQMSLGSFIWKSDPFESLQEEGGDGKTRYAGTDFLAAYWPLQRLGLIDVGNAGDPNE